MRRIFEMTSVRNLTLTYSRLLLYRFLVNYVYGFNTTSHIFFVIVQKRSHLPGDEEKGYVTRLARVCVSDVNYDSYTEVTLECGGGYGIVRDAFFVDQVSMSSNSFFVTDCGKNKLKRVFPGYFNVGQ